MTVSLKHKFVSAIPDGPDATIVRPSNWNDEHELLVAQGKLIGRFSSGTGAAEEITIGSGLSYTGGTLVVTSGGTGTVTSVDVSGSTTGLTFTGGPITTAGTITLGGTLGIANGGTGATTAATARANLSAAVLGANGDITSLTGLTGGISTPTFLQFSTATTPTTGVGRLSWNQADGTLNLGLLGGNVTLQIGQEQVVRVVNKSGTALTDGQIVYLSGAQGNRVKVDLAISNGSTAIARTVLGIVTEAIANNAEGFVTISGLVRDLNTSAYVDGDILYLSSTTAGAITNVRPPAPDHVVVIGYCVNANPSVGSIFVSVQPGYDLEDLSDVTITTPSAGQLLIYNNTTKVWVNNTLTAGSGIAITNTDGAISIAATNFGTVTSVSGSGGTTGLTLTGGPITASGTLTLGGTLNIANGGTGAITQQLALNALAGAVTSGSYLRGNGTNVLMATIQAADVPTLNQNTTGTAANVTGTVVVANGGTGATTLTGYVKASGTTAMTASASIPSTDISGLGTMSTQNANAVSVTGGAIDGTTVGATTRSTGAFTSLAYNTTLTGGTGVVALGTDQFYKDATGNVGIGTASPSTVGPGSKLVVYNAGYAAISIVSDGSSNTQLRFDNTLGAYLNNLSNTPMLFYNNATEKMRLDAAGNLGINIAAPIAKLHILDEGSSGFFMDGYANTSGPIIRTRAARGTLAAPTAVTANTLLGGMRGFGYNGTSFGSAYAGGVNINAAETFTTIAQGTYVTVNTTALGAVATTERMRIDAAGNVGIGNTPSGTYKLEVTGAIAATGAITSSVATGTAPLVVASTTNVANLNASSLNGATFAAPGAIGGGTAAAGTFTTLTATTNINSTRINPRVGTVASSATITPTGDASDQYTVTALATAATIAIPSGTPVDGQRLTLRIKDNGTARALTWTTSAGGYRIVGTTLPTTTVISKTVYVGCVYNAADSFWDVIAVAQQV